MQDLRLVLIIVGTIAIIALLLHGLWSSRKEQPSKFKDKPLQKMDNVSKTEIERVEKHPHLKNAETSPTLTPEPSVTSERQEPKFAPVDDDNEFHDEVPSMSATEKATPCMSSKTENLDMTLSIDEAEKKANFAKQKAAALKVKEEQASTLKVQDAEKTAQPSTNKTQTASAQEEQLVIVLHVHAQKDRTFSGNRLFNSMEHNGLEFGEFSIYHRHIDDGKKRKVIFSVANSIKPGTFDRAQSNFSTPSISFFMSLPCFGDAEQNFKLMLQTAQKIASDLGGTVQDQQRKMITPQKINEYRTKVRHFIQK